MHRLGGPVAILVMIGVFAPSKQAASAMTRARDCVVKGGALSVGGAGQARQDFIAAVNAELDGAAPPAPRR